MKKIFYTIALATMACLAACHNDHQIYWEKAEASGYSNKGIAIDLSAEIPAPTDKAAKTMRANVIDLAMARFAENNVDFEISYDDMNKNFEQIRKHYKDDEGNGNSTVEIAFKPIEYNDYLVVFQHDFIEQIGDTKGYASREYHILSRKNGKAILDQNIWKNSGNRKINKLLSEKYAELSAISYSRKELKALCKQTRDEFDLLVTPDSLFYIRVNNVPTGNGIKKIGFSALEVADFMKEDCPIFQYWKNN